MSCFAWKAMLEKIVKNNQLLKTAGIIAVCASSMRNRPIIFDDDFIGILLDMEHILVKSYLSLNEYFAFLKLAESGGRQPLDSETRAAVWEACGDSGALQVLVDLLNVK
ncbi:hypothetical protein CK203_019798 [Vitis vinifera]|uniref:Uncharacterized protein n=1 Tax=Vitis vinifera TaxID=29760 RepID=A0A438JQN7_VITVI|nr:hypothetical protein CK203_105088 [Vitis vinifera]RVX11266.1 hypothetical protein CK203_019798 [Vitis vinifera]